MKVNVYTHARDPWRGKPRPPLILAYTMYQGPNACVHDIEARTGTEAKRKAITEHRERCLLQQTGPADAA
ncbi:MAG TPA: hypothetical protein DCQ64_04570 [Candidatus Rokubacteria bacterium]|nr:hypothetical protein [Candidatus Rokubacteria bacterium]